MYGAILGDIIGSPYEFDRGGKTKDFPYRTCNSHDHRAWCKNKAKVNRP